MINGFTRQEASEFVDELFDQRAAAIRSNGIKYSFAGALIACVPVGMWLICLRTGIILPRTLVVTIAIGLAGLGLLIKGLFMVFAPKSASGDVAEQ